MTNDDLVETADSIPAGEFRHELTLNDIYELLIHALPSYKYSNISMPTAESLMEAGTRYCFRAVWGKKTPVIIKVDKPQSELLKQSQRALDNFKRGCGTERDLEFLAEIDNPEKHYLTRIRDFGTLGTGQVTIPFIVEDWFGGKSLARFGQVNNNQFGQIFSQVISGTRYLNNEIGIYHRDIKPSNILVREATTNRDGDYNLEVRITDFASACRKEDAQESIMPTAGGHLITNPFLFGSLTGAPGRYDDTSELYSIGTTMFFSLTGKYLFEINPTKGTASVISTGENLMTGNHLDTKKYVKAVKKEMSQNLWGHKYGGVIENCLLAPVRK